MKFKYYKSHNLFTNNLLKKIILTLCSLFYSYIIFAATVPIKKSAQENFQHQLENLTSMSADFVQIVKTKLETISISKGHLDLIKPKRFRWEITAPSHQIIIGTGKDLWIYDIDLEEATRKSQQENLKGAAGIFLNINQTSFTKNYKIQQELTQQTIKYQLTTTDHKDSFISISFIFKHNILVGLELLDYLGQTTLINFKNIKTNISLPAKLFTFIPPKHIDIIE